MLENFRIKTLKQVRQFKERLPLQSSIRQDSESTLEQDSPQKDQNLPTQRILFSYQNEGVQICLKPTIIKLGCNEIQYQSLAKETSEAIPLQAVSQFLNRIIQKTVKMYQNFKQFDDTILDQIPSPGEESEDYLISCQMKVISELFKELKSLFKQLKELSFSTSQKLQSFDCSNAIDSQQAIQVKVVELLKRYEDSSAAYDLQVKKLQRENIIYSKQIIELKQEIETFKQTQKEIQEWTDVKDNSKDCESKSDKTRQSDSKNQENSDFRILNEKLEEENQYLTQKLQQQMDQILQLKQNQELILKNHQIQLANLQNTITQKSKAVQSLQEEYQELQAKNTQNEEDLQNLEQSYGDLYTQYKKLQSIAEDDAQTKELYIQELMEQKEELEQVEEDFKESEIDYEKQIDEKDQKIEKLSKELDRIKKIVDKFKRGSTDQLRSQIQNLQIVPDQSFGAKMEENQQIIKSLQEEVNHYKKLYENLDKTFKKLIQFQNSKQSDPKLSITNEQLILPAFSTTLALSQVVRVARNLEKVPDEKYKFVQNLLGQDYSNNLI